MRDRAAMRRREPKRRMKRLASAGLISPIDEQAAVWAVEAAHGEMTAESRADLDAWLAADTRHRGAYIRACAWLRATEVAVIGSAHVRTPVSNAQLVCRHLLYK